jgi:dUTP pyrophosphatase
MFLKYAICREGAQSPSRANPNDAGLDFYMPEMTKEFREYFYSCGKNGELGIVFEQNVDKIMMTIPPGKNVLIPSGIKVEIPFGFMGLFLNKSGVASKKELLVGAQVVDTFYSGEVHIDLHNVGQQEARIAAGDKLIQMTLVPAMNTDVVLVGEEDLYDWMKKKEVRGEKGFGSTDGEKSKVQAGS